MLIIVPKVVFFLFWAVVSTAAITTTAVLILRAFRRHDDLIESRKEWQEWADQEYEIKQKVREVRDEIDYIKLNKGSQS